MTGQPAAIGAVARLSDTAAVAQLTDTPAVAQLTGGPVRPGGLELTDRALARCALPPGVVAVDVGCGTGISVDHLRTRHGLAALGVDLSAAAVAAGRDRSAGLPLLQAAAERLPLAAACADAVLVECVLSLLPDPGRALAEFARVLRPRGRLVVSDLYTRVRANGRPPRRPPPGPPSALDLHQLLDSLHTNGLRTTSWEDHTAALARLAVQLIWDGGPGLLACSRGAGAPGYFLLLAEKGEADR